MLSFPSFLHLFPLLLLVDSGKLYTTTGQLDRYFCSSAGMSSSKLEIVTTNCLEVISKGWELEELSTSRRKNWFFFFSPRSTSINIRNLVVYLSTWYNFLGIEVYSWPSPNITNPLKGKCIILVIRSIYT